MTRIAHLTSAHPRYDTRIFLKQCRSLAAAGYDVTLVVADDAGNGSKEAVRIVDVGRPRGRLDRMLVTTRRVFREAVAQDAAIYHLHDPELIPAGMALKRRGKKVIFDSHEDVPKQLLGKPYLGRVSRHALSGAFSLFEQYACRQFDGIVAATPSIGEKFRGINGRTADVNNFPLLGELDAAIAWTDKRQEVCYVGGIGAIRGIREVVEAAGLVESGARLNLVGAFSEPGLEAQVETLAGWGRVNQLGFVDRCGVRDVMQRSVAGLVTFLPMPNHIDSQPNKMFEYMSAGIPVIASNFPLWRDIIERNECGVCVDPLDPKAIAGAIDYLVRNPDIAKRMGENGRKAVLDQYNWPVQAIKLTEFYAAILRD